jgi:hypothetical protein
MRVAILSILAGSALAITAAQPASAATLLPGSQVSINGFVTPLPLGTNDASTATALDFNAGGNVSTPGTPGIITSYTGSGSLNFVCTTSCGTIQDLTSLTIGALPISNFLLLTNGIAFDLTSITSVDRSSPFLNITAAGTFRVTGYDPTPGVFYLSTQANGNTTFSASTVAVPEPATWALMLLGFGGIGMAMRRRRRPALAQVA